MTKCLLVRPGRKNQKAKVSQDTIVSARPRCNMFLFAYNLYASDRLQKSKDKLFAKGAIHKTRLQHGKR